MMNEIDKRTAFELHLKQTGRYTDLTKGPDGKYQKPRVQDAWEAFQAAANMKTEAVAVGLFVQRSKFGAWIEVENHEEGAVTLYRLAAHPTEQRMSDAAIRPAKSHCQNGGDVCLAGNRDGVCCPEDSCDIDDGTRKNPIDAACDAKDAARYRWLSRQAVASHSGDDLICRWEVDYLLRGESFSDAIDAARNAEIERQGGEA